ncbi:DUF6286 domain-containing protein [Streptomyces mobaraensis]|uniref:DUF6286 domain-containing protein n=1 Tax=Streptomyces mobaraensis TaxID=35621 RepID=A0A5N5W7D5_STRMB|nr:DUF6286 domain-containing protein [Streptomyces mobaraensis]KAB7843245.1 hypothetical protein FRZ00_18010 [Streptomyces mobaraensis]
MSEPTAPPAPDPAEPPEPPEGTERLDVGRAGRFWSARRLPAALIALVVLGLTGLFLYDVAAVRAGHPAMGWRRRLARELAHRPLGDGWIVTGAVLAVLAGIWLLVLAVTPGRRAVLPMRRETPDLRAGLDRRAAALVLRDRVMEVPGVQSVRVEVGRIAVRARAQAHFRDLDEVRTDVDGVLADGVRELGLARRPVLSVRVRRPARR